MKLGGKVQERVQLYGFITAPENFGKPPTTTDELITSKSK